MRIQAWRAYASVSQSLHVRLDECRMSPYGAPELRGFVEGRPFIVWSTEGRSNQVLLTAISVGQRVQIESRVSIYPGGTNPWVEGSMKWKRHSIPIPDTNVAVDLLGPKKHEVEAIERALMGNERARCLVAELLRPDEIDQLRWRSGWFDVFAPGFLANAPLIGTTLDHAVHLAEAVESSVSAVRLTNLPAGGPRRHRISARSGDTFFAGCLVAVAVFLTGVAVFVPNDLGSTGAIWLGIIAVGVGLMGGSRIYASWLGPEERRLLRQSTAIENA